MFPHRDDRRAGKADTGAAPHTPQHPQTARGCKHCEPHAIRCANSVMPFADEAIARADTDYRSRNPVWVELRVDRPKTKSLAAPRKNPTPAPADVVVVVVI